MIIMETQANAGQESTNSKKVIQDVTSQKSSLSISGKCNFWYFYEHIRIGGEMGEIFMKTIHIIL